MIMEEPKCFDGKIPNYYNGKMTSGMWSYWCKNYIPMTKRGILTCQNCSRKEENKWLK